MRKIYFLTLLVLLPLNFSAQIFQFTFTGAAVCPTPGNTPTSQAPNTVVSPLNRVGANCTIASAAFNSSNWSTNSAIDQNTYVEVTVFAAGGHQLTISSFSFDTERSSTGPVAARVALDPGTGTFSQFYDYTPTSNPNNIFWDFPDASVSAGYTVRFRIYGWGAFGSGGTMRLNNLKLQGIVTDQTMWNITGNSATNPALNFLGTIDNQDLVVRTNNNEKMRVTSGGKITMGGANLSCSDCSNYRLFVKDGIRTERIKIDIASADGWADYVFKKDYKLPSLEDVEKHITEKGHLPNVPSADEVLKDGINVGEMNTKLLEKIEELTLYSIELNKKNKGLNTKVQKQEQLIKQLQNRMNKFEKQSK